MFKYEELYARSIPHLRITPSGQSYGKCIWHDDKAASFSCHLETGFFYCHAGCGNGNAITFSRRVGVRPPAPALPEYQPSAGLISSSRLERAAPSPHPSEQKKIVATYQYQYEDGSNAYQVIRFEPKSFVQRRWDGNKWIWGTTGIRRVPYNLPALMKATKVILCEGEKDADKLGSLGVVATTTPMGAGAWDVAYGSFFRGKNVAIIPDNDLPGKEYAKNAARDISAAGGVVRVVELPGVPEKGDVSDYLDIGTNSLATLLDLIRTAPVQKAASANTQPPLQYFAECDVLIPDGKGALPTEYETLCKESYKQFMGVAQNWNDRVMALIDELEIIWRGCCTERRYSQFLWKLKEIHIASLA